MIPLILTLLSLIAMTVHYFGNLPKAQNTQINTVSLDHQAPVIAEVKNLEGKAEKKRSQDLNWAPLRKGDHLTTDHQLSTHKDSTATLEFRGSKAKLNIPENTLLSLGTVLNDPGNMRRLFYLESTAAPRVGDLERKYASPAFARVHWALKRRPEVAKEVGTAGPKDLTLLKEVKSLTRIAPKGDLNLVVNMFPAVVSASFKNPTGTDTVIHGYLWNEEMGADPVWEGTSTGYFPAIPINRKGSYVFQAVSEDDVYVSLPWFITAVPLDK